MSVWTPYFPENEVDLWRAADKCNALYECPKDSTGKRLGPLVPYAGKDGQNRNLVGDVYFNFARIEEQPWVVSAFATTIFEKIKKTHQELLEADSIVGIPDGGRSLGQELARIMRKRFIYPAKIPRPKPEGATKEEFNLLFKRIEIEEGERVILCDDVHNNFQNTEDALDAVAECGGKVIALCSGLNRSPHVDQIFVPKRGKYVGLGLPVVCAIRKPLPEYEQDDPAVAEDIQKGLLESHVKQNWAKLKEIMHKHQAQ